MAPVPRKAPRPSRTTTGPTAKGDITVKDGALSHEGRWLRLVPTTLSDAQKAKLPHLAKGTAWSVDPRDRDRVREALRGQVIATRRAADDALLAATGVHEAPGVITVKPGDLVVVFNATPDRQSQRLTEPDAGTYRLHPVQAAGADRVVRSATCTRSTGTCEVPGRSVAVFAR